MPSSVMPTSERGNGQMPPAAISTVGLRKSYGDKLVLDGIDLRIPARHRLRPARPERRRQDHRRQDPLHAHLRRRRLRRGARRRPRPGRRPAGGTRRDRRHRAVLRGRQPDHRRGEHAPHGGPAPPLPPRGPPHRRRAAGALRPHGRGEEARVHLLRRHEAPPGPRHDAGRQPADHLPRRADHRPRPALPPQHVADHPRAGHRRRHRLPHHAVPGGGRRARRPHRGAQRRQDRRRGHRRGAEAADPRRSCPAPLLRPGRVPVRRLRPARGHPGRRGPAPCRSPATAASASCAPSSTGWTRPASRRTS